MITQSLGIVAPASTSTGTICTVNSTKLNPGLGQNPLSFWAQACSFQALKTNTGTILICDTPNPNLTTGIGVLWELPVPQSSDGKSLPAWVIGDPSRPNNPVNVAQFFVLPSVSGEGCRVSAVRSGTQQTTLT